MTRERLEEIKRKAEAEGWEERPAEWLEGFRECLCSWLFQVDGDPSNAKWRWTRKETVARIHGALRGIHRALEGRGEDGA